MQRLERPAPAEGRTPPAPSYAQGSLVRYSSGPPYHRLQEGIVLAVLEGDRLVIGWLTGISGPLAIADPGLELVEISG